MRKFANNTRPYPNLRMRSLFSDAASCFEGAQDLFMHN